MDLTGGGPRMPASTARTQRTSREPLRFAHPFFTPVSPEERPAGPYGRRMLDFVKAQLQRIPEPTRPPVMTLADIVGAPSAQAIEATGHLRFHTVGDTGKGLDTEQGVVAQAMRDDFDFHQPAQ